jgi:transposase
MRKSTRFVYGIDLGDRMSHVCELDTKTGAVGIDMKVPTTKEALGALFCEIPRSLVVMECCGSSPWISRLAVRAGHEVIVADARKLRVIWDTTKKNDRRDALVLAQAGAERSSNLVPVRHRSEKTQRHLGVVRTRTLLVEARTKLVNGARGIVKTEGERLPRCSAESFAKNAAGDIPEELRAALGPLVDVLSALNAAIREHDKEIERLGRDVYPVTQLLREVPGVGVLTSLAYVLVIEDPARFQRSRDVGAYVGVVPRQDQSGESDRQLPITKCGDGLLRRLLVQSAHHVLGPFGKESQLRTWGLALAARGGRNAKKRAVVAVARKLAVLLHAMWKSGEHFEPQRGSATTVKAA